MQKHKEKTKALRWYPHPVSPPKPKYKSTNPHLFHLPIICNNNTMDMVLLVKVRQSNECGSVRNDEIINLHLRSGAGPWINIPWLLQNTSHINQEKTKESKNEIQLPTNHIVLPWPTHTEPSAKRGRPGT